MLHGFRGFGLAATFVLVSGVALVSTAKAQTTTSAYLYVQSQGPAGPIHEYRASSTGQLVSIAGSPFKPGTEMVGATGTKFFTLGKTLIHSYGIASDGVIGSQLSQIPFFDYAGSDCPRSTSAPMGAVIDHTGKYFYVLLSCTSAPSDCSEYQSYLYQSYLIRSDGSFAFDGETEDNYGLVSCPNSPSDNLPSILGNESFAYAETDDGHLSGLIGFRRTSAGVLELMQFTEKDPSFGACDGEVEPRGPDASPVGNYVVLQLFPCDSSPAYLGSYTVDSNGNISSTNTSSNMPRSSIVSQSKFSPSGDLFVAYGDGIEIYKFNGAAPLTLWKTLLTGKGIAQVAFDRSNHLYVISNSENKLYVFTVTSTSVTQTSSITIGSPFKMVVVSR